MTACIEVTRSTRGFQDRFRKYWVDIDGESVGRVSRGGSFLHDVAPGPHEVRVRIDWCSSPMAVVEVKNEEMVRLACGPNAPLNPWRVYWKTDSYLYLKNL